MNKQRRKLLDALIERFESLKSQLAEAIEPISNDIGDAKSAVTTLRDEIQEAYDEMSEGRQNSERGQQIYSEIGSLTDADDKLEDSLQACMDCVSELGEAIEELRAATGDQL